MKRIRVYRVAFRLEEQGEHLRKTSKLIIATIVIFVFSLLGLYG
jgi:hypothetical protein